MDRTEQKQLTREIAEHAVEHVIKQIEAGKIPEDWDGIELRWYLEERISWHRDDPSRKRAYRNTLMVNGL
jgi:hypothetical protein